MRAGTRAPQPSRRVSPSPRRGSTHRGVRAGAAPGRRVYSRRATWPDRSATSPSGSTTHPRRLRSRSGHEPGSRRLRPGPATGGNRPRPFSIPGRPSARRRGAHQRGVSLLNPNADREERCSGALALAGILALGAAAECEEAASARRHPRCSSRPSETGRAALHRSGRRRSTDTSNADIRARVRGYLRDAALQGRRDRARRGSCCSRSSPTRVQRGRSKRRRRRLARAPRRAIAQQGRMLERDAGPIQDGKVVAARDRQRRRGSADADDQVQAARGAAGAGRR